MKISVPGALFGAAVGAIARGLVIVLNVGSPVFILALPSASIGALVGLIAGSLRHPLLAAGVGAVLSGLVFEFFMIACSSMISWFDADGAKVFFVETLLYGIEMGLAGALAGFAGCAFGKYYANLRKDDPPA